MATTWGLSGPPAAATGVDGDVFVSTVTHEQWRKDAGVWTALAPGENRADIVPITGAVNLHLAKRAARSFDTQWVNASEGLVYTENFTSSPTWNVQHRLGSRFVDVTVIAPGNHNATAEQTVIIPRISFDSTLACVLNFAGPVAGTVIVRR